MGCSSLTPLNDLMRTSALAVVGRGYVGGVGSSAAALTATTQGAAIAQAKQAGTVATSGLALASSISTCRTLPISIRQLQMMRDA
jgi:hypothetical protein